MTKGEFSLLVANKGMAYAWDRLTEEQDEAEGLAYESGRLTGHNEGVQDHINFVRKVHG